MTSVDDRLGTGGDAMPKEDEVRESGETPALIDAYLLSDPERLLERYRGAQAAGDRRAAAARRDTERIKAQLNAQLSKLQGERASVVRQLGTTRSSLEASRKEIQRLKSDLERVRSSRSMRVGRALLAPLRVLKDLGRTGRREETVPALAGPHEPLRPTREAAPLRRPIGDMTLEELEQLFDSEPSAQTLAWVISRQWFGHGLVTEPAGLLAQHQDLVDQFEPRERRTADRILGTARLMADPVEVPARSRGAAYLPEPGRIMYCVHSTPAYSSNGYSTRTRGVASGLVAAGGDVTVVGRVGYPWDSKVDVKKPPLRRTVQKLDGITYAHVPGADLNVTGLDVYLQVAIDAFVREARLSRPEVIQAASNYLTALPALVAARRLGVPFVYEVRGLWEVTEASGKPGWEETERYRLTVELESLVAREADIVLAITAEVAEVLKERGVDAERIVLAPNAVDPNVFLPLPKDVAFADQRKIRTDVPVIGFAGSIVEYEGLDRLLAASTLLVERGVDHQVVIAGSGTAMDALKAQRNADGLTNVLLLGRLPMDQMPRLLSTFDIMPCPRRSLPVTELVSPLKPLESFGCGKAVVLTDLAPHRTLAGPEGDRALLVPDGDIPALADALQRLVEDADLRADLGRAGRLWVVDERSWAVVGEAMARAQVTAREHHSLHAASGRPLNSLRVGIIADEFTTSTLAPSVELVPLGRSEWRDQITDEPIDLLFVESAWKGNDGEWHRGVGHYSDEESADVQALLAACRERGIPSVFWNKEDPVHFDRFRTTAAACDHVFTTDAAMIEPYLNTQDGVLRTASGLPFYAQPAIHNPLPSDRAYEPTVAYAGTYYGARYADRSRQLDALLDAALEFGLTIYDRQLAVPDSPYHFPAKYAENVRGVLPYDEVIESYRSHLAHINVNSVTDSPTMFSRRVVEVAACGGIVLSGPGRGIQESLGPGVLATSEPMAWRGYLHAWVSEPTERVREQWRQMRTVYRAHTVDTALALVARTAGVPVELDLRPRYGALVEGWDCDALTSLARQSVRPEIVYVLGDPTLAVSQLEPLGIEVRDGASAGVPDVEWIGRWHGALGRTHAEDLLLAARFGDWNRIAWRSASDADAGQPLVRPMEEPRDAGGLVHRSLVRDVASVDEALLAQPVRGVEWVVPVRAALVERVAAPDSVNGVGRTVLVAGHDLKFARGILADLEASGHRILIDEWRGHNQHDEARSLELLAAADVVFCEWGLGNLAWYSKHVSPRQRLVARVHAQEVRLPYLRDTKHEAVDQYLFVGELIRRAAIVSHGVPAHRTAVIPNAVATDSLRQPKLPGSDKTVGLVGIVPRMKRLDLALDVMEGLLAADENYRLLVKGSLPSDYPWMAHRPEEMAWYEAQFERAERLNAKFPASVVFEGHGTDMADWYRRIGVALSVSDHESFHLTLADGAASGAMPAALAWGGADLIYPREWLSPTVEHLVGRILGPRPDPAGLHAAAAGFDQGVVSARLAASILGDR